MTVRMQDHKSTSDDSDLSPARAAEESCRIVGIAGFYPERKLGMDYVEQFMPILEQRLVTAGRRLAGKLNLLYGS